jgi:hypothetical protein
VLAIMTIEEETGNAFTGLVAKAKSTVLFTINHATQNSQLA